MLLQDRTLDRTFLCIISVRYRGKHKEQHHRRKQQISEGVQHVSSKVLVCCGPWGLEIWVEIEAIEAIAR